MERRSKVIKGNRIQKPLFDAETGKWHTIERDMDQDDFDDGYVLDEKGNLVYKKISEADGRQW